MKSSKVSIKNMHLEFNLENGNQAMRLIIIWLVMVLILILNWILKQDL